jgi:nucleotide-binding universal stress UspA family protein
VKDIQSTVVQGDPANRIMEFAKTEGVDMIVIGSRGLTGMKGVLLGSVSHKVFHLADNIYITVIK